MTYFLDTNIVSYIIKGNSEIRTKTARLLADGNDVKIPIVTYYEVKRGLLATGAISKLQRFLTFAEKLGIVNTTLQTYDIAA